MKRSELIKGDKYLVQLYHKTGRNRARTGDTKVRNGTKVCVYIGPASNGKCLFNMEYTRWGRRDSSTHRPFGDTSWAKTGNKIPVTKFRVIEVGQGDVLQHVPDKSSVTWSEPALTMPTPEITPAMKIDPYKLTIIPGGNP